MAANILKINLPHHWNPNQSSQGTPKNRPINVRINHKIYPCMSHTIKLNQIGVEERGKGVNLTIDPYAYICRTSTITTINSLTERPRPLSLQPPPPAPAGWTEPFQRVALRRRPSGHPGHFGLYVHLWVLTFSLRSLSFQWVTIH